MSTEVKRVSEHGFDEITLETDGSFHQFSPDINRAPALCVNLITGCAPCVDTPYLTSIDLVYGKPKLDTE